MATRLSTETTRPAKDASANATRIAVAGSAWPSTSSAWAEGITRDGGCGRTTETQSLLSLAQAGPTALAGSGSWATASLGASDAAQITVRSTLTSARPNILVPRQPTVSHGRTTHHRSGAQYSAIRGGPRTPRRRQTRTRGRACPRRTSERIVSARKPPI